MKNCPFCAEEIQDAAIVCKHCGRDIARSAAPPLPNPPPTSPASQNVLTKTVPNRPLYGSVAVIVGFVMALVSSASAGFGFFLIWIGLGFTLSGGAIKRWGGGFLAALMLMSIGMAIGRNSSSTSTSTAATSSASASTAASATAAVAAASAPSTPSYDLALLASKGYESEYGGYHYVEGQVKNVSDKPLRNVAAVATWLDKDGNFIKADDALIDYNPILPGQTSPFKTITSGNPEMSKYRVEFKTLMGGTLSVDDQRKGK